ncbi:TPA: hypothetical protein HH292_05895 [Xanthomonas vasicola pv. zeae]|nr:hypothetical protein [Xanthomonas vasicola pv. zeae]
MRSIRVAGSTIIARTQVSADCVFDKVPRKGNPSLHQDFAHEDTFFDQAHAGLSQESQVLLLARIFLNGSKRVAAVQWQWQPHRVFLAFFVM